MRLKLSARIVVETPPASAGDLLAGRAYTPALPHRARTRLVVS